LPSPPCFVVSWMFGVSSRGPGLSESSGESSRLGSSLEVLEVGLESTTKFLAITGAEVMSLSAAGGIQVKRGRKRQGRHDIGIGVALTLTLNLSCKDTDQVAIW
jgi:hypothetical protein